MFSNSGRSDPLNVYKVVPNKNPITQGETICLKCLYTLNKGEHVTDLDWYHNGAQVFKYTQSGDVLVYFPSNHFEADVNSYKIIYIEKNAL